MKYWVIVFVSLLFVSCSSSKGYKARGFSHFTEQEDYFHFNATIKEFSGEYKEEVNFLNCTKLNIEIACEKGEILLSLLDSNNSIVYVKKSSNLNIVEEMELPQGKYNLVLSGNKIKNAEITVRAN